MEKLITLKEKLINEDRFDLISKYFLDNFCKDREFLDMGCFKGNDIIETALTKVGEYLFKRAFPITGLSLRYIEKYNFYHGCAMVESKPATVFYFEDVHMGMINLINDVRENRIEFIRFTSFESKEGYFDISFGGNLPQ